MTSLKPFAICLVVVGASVYGLTSAATQTAQRRRATAPEQQSSPSAAKSKAQPPLNPMREYVVEPPDLLVVEVLEALPGRPVSGERLVRPDGKISLGFYGDLYVAGLTLPEIKEKIVLHLKKFMDDSQLGLVAGDNPDDDAAPPLPFTEEPERREENARPASTSPARKSGARTGGGGPARGQKTRVEPRDTDRVFVDVSAYNSKVYYVQGELGAPGRIPITGRERILDAINFAGGLTPDADHEQVFLYRQPSDGGEVQTWKIDIDQIMLGDDLSSNHQLVPGDRLVVRRRSNHAGPKDDNDMEPAPPPRTPAGDERDFNHRTPVREQAEPQPIRLSGLSDNSAILRLERRMNEFERKLDRILEALSQRRD